MRVGVDACPAGDRRAVVAPDVAGAVELEQSRRAVAGGDLDGERVVVDELPPGDRGSGVAPDLAVVVQLVQLAAGRDDGAARAPGHHIHCVRDGVDHRCGGDADRADRLGADLGADDQWAPRVQVALPDATRPRIGACVVGVERVDIVGRGGDEEQVPGAARRGHATHVKRLRVYVAVHDALVQLAELRRSDGGGRKLCLGKVRAAAACIVAVCGDVVVRHIPSLRKASYSSSMKCVLSDSPQRPSPLRCQLASISNTSVDQNGRLIKCPGEDPQGLLELTLSLIKLGTPRWTARIHRSVVCRPSPIDSLPGRQWPPSTVVTGWPGDRVTG